MDRKDEKMKKVTMIFSLALILQAITNDEIIDMYENGEYEKVCSIKVEQFYRKTNDEAIINIYASSCLRSDQINKLSYPISKLVKSKEARENAAYFSNIMFQKKLLYHAIIDGVDISYVRLPKSDYILSMIFDKFVKNQYEKDGYKYIFREENDDTFYEITQVKSEGITKLILKIYKDDKLIGIKEYW